MRTYKAVFFDFDGTLRLPDPDPALAFVLLARQMRIDVDLATERRLRIWAHNYWSQYDRITAELEEWGEDGFWSHYSRLLLQRIGVNRDLEPLGEQVREYFQTAYRPSVRPAPGSCETLQALRDAGYHLCLLSNRQEPYVDIAVELGLADYFDVILAAGEVGYWKPHPAVFHAAMARFPALQPDACVYVGDNYYADGIGAEAAGMTPVIFDPDRLYTHIPHHRIERIDQLLTEVLSVGVAGCPKR